MTQKNQNHSGSEDINSVIGSPSTKSASGPSQNQICEKCKFDKACNDKIGKIIDCSDFKPKDNNQNTGNPGNNQTPQGETLSPKGSEGGLISADTKPEECKTSNSFIFPTSGSQNHSSPQETPTVAQIVKDERALSGQKSQDYPADTQNLSEKFGGLI